jgi:hypothetical protein
MVNHTAVAAELSGEDGHAGGHGGHGESAASAVSFIWGSVARVVGVGGECLMGVGWGEMGLYVKGLYCKRPIQCLAFSEILTPHPLTARQVCTPPPLRCGGEDTLAKGRGGGGVNSLKDARHCSVLYICKYFVGL